MREKTAGVEEVQEARGSRLRRLEAHGRSRGRREVRGKPGSRVWQRLRRHARGEGAVGGQGRWRPRGEVGGIGVRESRGWVGCGTWVPAMVTTEILIVNSRIKNTVDIGTDRWALHE